MIGFFSLFLSFFLCVCVCVCLFLFVCLFFTTSQPHSHLKTGSGGKLGLTQIKFHNKSVTCGKRK